jgi:hypothetical protein
MRARKVTHWPSCELEHRDKREIKCARTDCCGAYGPLASLTLVSPCGRPNRLRRFVEPPTTWFEVAKKIL